MSATYPIFTNIVNQGTSASSPYIRPLSRALTVTVTDVDSNVVDVFDIEGVALANPFIVAASAKGRFKFRAAPNKDYIVSCLEPISNSTIILNKNGSYDGYIFGQDAPRITDYTLALTDIDLNVETSGDVVITIPDEATLDLTQDNNRIFTHTITHLGGGVISFNADDVTLVTQSGYSPTMSQAGLKGTLSKSTVTPDKWFLNGFLDTNGSDTTYWGSVTSGGVTDRTDDTWWQTLVDGGVFNYDWTGTQWEHPVTNMLGLMGLQVITFGANENWHVAFRPTAINITVNSGLDEGNFGSFGGNEIDIIDSNGDIIGSTVVGFVSYDQDVDVSIPLTFGSYDLNRIVFETYLYNTSTIVKSITFDE